MIGTLRGLQVVIHRVRGEQGIRHGTSVVVSPRHLPRREIRVAGINAVCEAHQLRTGEIVKIIVGCIQRGTRVTVDIGGQVEDVVFHRHIRAVVSLNAIGGVVCEGVIMDFRSSGRRYADSSGIAVQNTAMYERVMAVGQGDPGRVVGQHQIAQFGIIRGA